MSDNSRAKDFDHVRYAGGRLGMTDVALDGTDGARLVTAFLDDGRNRADLDRIAQSCSGAVGFYHVPDRSRSITQSGLDQQLL